MTVSDVCKTLRNHSQVFITGPGGVGKTYSVRKICSRFSNVMYLGSTNQSAILIGGDTVHSVFRLGICKTKEELIAYDKEYYKWFIKVVNNDLHKAKESLYNKIRSNFRNTDLIVIDEISMISAEILDLIFYRFEQICINVPPILFVGDLYQLPPVSKEGSKSNYIFKSKNFKPYIIELTKIKRTDNLKFAEAQKHIRMSKYTRLVDEVIKEIEKNKFDNSFNPCILCATNKQADKINKEKMELLDTEPITFTANICVNNKSLTEKSVEKIINEFQADKVITLKPGCKVMCVSTIKDLGIYNGMQCTYIGYNGDNDSIEIEKENGSRVSLNKYDFVKYNLENISGENIYSVEVSMNQFPVKLSYAITIHKSQGMTIDNVLINCKRMFASGQFYVAISRAKDPNRIKLLNFDRRYVRIENNPVYNFYIENKDNILKVEEISEDKDIIEVEI